MTHLYKNQLQVYCQKRNINFPVYISEREGPPHALRFKSKVLFDGKTYESAEYFNTVKDAEHAAAKVAWMSVSSDISEEDDSGLFKNLLQELAQREYSCLPSYNTTRSGPSHNPIFVSTVEIHDLSFTGEEAKTKKLGEMYAAKVAYIALKERANADALQITHTSIDSQQPKLNEPVQTSFSTVVSSSHRYDKKVKDMTHLYKNQLQAYCQKRNINLPVYISEREGPPHALRFKSKVLFDGKIYESAEYFSTVKDAEHAAAKVALMSVSSDKTEEEDPGFFKNLLQELAQRAYSCLPSYNTTRSGPSHNPIFVSTVEIHDLSFTGEEAKTKKLGEMCAAKVAYFDLKARLHQGNGAKVTKVCTNRGQNICQPNVDTFPFRRDDSLNSPDALSHDHSIPRIGVFNSNFSACSGVDASSHKRIKVFPATPNMTLPAGVKIMRQDNKWVAMTMDSTHDSTPKVKVLCEASEDNFKPKSPFNSTKPLNL